MNLEDLGEVGDEEEFPTEAAPPMLYERSSCFTMRDRVALQSLILHVPYSLGSG